MKPRERLLAVGFGAVVVLLGGNWAYESYIEEPLAKRQRRAEQLEEKIAAEEKKQGDSLKALRALEQWEARSLPADPQIARSLYQAWLLELVGRAELQNPNVDSAEPSNRKGMFTALAFSVRGRASLAQLTRFLHDFYSAGHLHRIQSLSVTPLARDGQLDLSIAIEALVLPGADRKDRLSDVAADRLALPTPADYNSIAQRDIFGTGGAFDAAAHAYLTAVLEVDGRSEAWFSLRSTDEMLKLAAGDKIEVGQFRGAVAEVYGSDVVIESDGERWLLTVGESLAEASSLPPEF